MSSTYNMTTKLYSIQAHTRGDLVVTIGKQVFTDKWKDIRVTDTTAINIGVPTRKHVLKLWLLAYMN